MSDFEAAPEAASSLSIVCSTAAMRSPKRTCVEDDVSRPDRCTYSKVAGKSRALSFAIVAYAFAPDLWRRA